MVQPRKPKANPKASPQDHTDPPQLYPTTPRILRKRGVVDEPSGTENNPAESPVTPKKPQTAEMPTPKLPPDFQKMLGKRRTPKTDPDKANQGRLSRSKEQRMVILHHNIDEDSWSASPIITFKIAGSVGNVYTTLIKKVPSCDCPDNTFRRARCKHILYEALVNALSVTEDAVFQKSFSEGDLAQMIKSSALSRVDRLVAEAFKVTPSTRRTIEGECAICFMEMAQTEDIIWCERLCGNNLHDSCFKQWAGTCHGTVTCVYCRAPWGQQDYDAQVESILAAGVPSGQYVNVASQLGMSTQRDHSFYRFPRRPSGPEGEGEGKGPEAEPSSQVSQ
ncbi:RING finger domain-containing protein [Penicillium soppii]|uniref:RING finger domain-containing protein n=1 Tax=Penicillium soppii TaxID=69789 RepID=UPI0025483619|nr:RING finger domain-containing protein [Penicillium soppii]KAJ5881727.1 RING finger domain-containing protein [Penicillium soppii]